MESINNCHTLFFDLINFEEDLVVNVIEGKKAFKSEQLVISGKNLGEAYSVQPDNSSKTFKITFERPVAWQVVDESYTSADDSEIFEINGLLSILSKSKYLDYVNGSHGFYKDVIGRGKHYRLWTEDQVIEVVSIEKPKIAVQ